MEWLKKLLGEENYKKLEENGSISMLKAVMGEVEHIPNDPTKIIPKSVFNQKNEEAKLLTQKVEAYELQLKERNNMITDDDLKKELAKKEAEFKTELTKTETQYKKDLEVLNKKTLLSQVLANEGAKGIDLLLNVVNFDDVIIEGDQVLNASKIIDPLKEKYDFSFGKVVTGGVPPKGDPNKPANTKEQLVEQYNRIPAGNLLERQQLRREIKAIEETAK